MNIPNYSDLKNLKFNEALPSRMHIDINSCFATVEQQFDKTLRNKPIVVAARNTSHACIVAPSIESKVLGIKTGMNVSDAKKIYPKVIVLVADPPKYRIIHKRLKRLLLNYTDQVIPKSIDEFVLELKNYPSFKKGMINTGLDIKRRIKTDVGDYIRVSIGIGSNRFLAKTAAGLKKPDGLEAIDFNNFKNIYGKLDLMDLNGISTGNAIRLNNSGIFSVLQFYAADFNLLKSAFKSISAYYWYLRLRGIEIDDFETQRSSFSNSYVLPKPLAKENEITPIIQKLVAKMSERLRANNYSARSVGLFILYKDKIKIKYGDTRLSRKDLFDTTDIYREIYKLYRKSPSGKLVKHVAVSCFHLKNEQYTQLEFFNDVEKDHNLSNTVDKINSRWGSFTIKPARMLYTNNHAPDTIAFGK